MTRLVAEKVRLRRELTAPSRRRGARQVLIERSQRQRAPPMKGAGVGPEQSSRGQTCRRHAVPTRSRSGRPTRSKLRPLRSLLGTHAPPAGIGLHCRGRASERRRWCQTLPRPLAPSSMALSMSSSVTGPTPGRGVSRAARSSATVSFRPDAEGKEAPTGAGFGVSSSASCAARWMSRRRSSSGRRRMAARRSSALGEATSRV